jgi:pimeloyl-ACP methyl ester carboxylesterase
MTTNRREFLRHTATAIAALTIADPRFAHAEALYAASRPNAQSVTAQAEAPASPPTTAPGDSSIRGFSYRAADTALADLRQRIADTRFPSKELVSDPSQGVQLATMQELMRYWGTEYDWRTVEEKLNALPQFMTNIDGLDVHFIHVKSPHPNALPLIVTHGWPGSILEMIEIIGPLTDPTAHGGSADDAFHVVLPSMPGYGFSAQPLEFGANAGTVALMWAELMRRLGYTRYVAQGGDQGALVTDAMGRVAANGLVGIHLNLLTGFPPAIAASILGGAPAPDGLSEQERTALSKATAVFRRGYITEMSQHPQTIGYGMADSPAGLAAWMLDHDGDSYDKISHALLDGSVSGDLTRDRIIDNLTLYWLTNTATSAARLYWEGGRLTAAAAASGQKPPDLSVPVGFSVFPGEIFQAPRSWAEAVYPNLIYFNEAEKGGHFAAWEEPDVFSQELRAAFRSLR